LLLLALALVAGGCGDSPTEPTQPQVNVAGDWSGTWTYEAAGLMVTDAVTMTLNQTDLTVTGTWTAESGASGRIDFEATTAVSGSLTINQSLLGSGSCNGATMIAGTASATRIDVTFVDIPPQGVCQWGTDNRIVVTR
jgi:hypothetical protein